MEQVSPLELEWYAIRDLFLGKGVQQNLKVALSRAQSCCHPNACWLASVFAGKNVNKFLHPLSVFLDRGDDASALCFAGLFSVPINASLLRRSSELGCAFASACLAERTFGEERFTLASAAAAHGERDGFYQLGVCFQFGYGCAEDANKARENYLLAARLDSVQAMCKYGEVSETSDPHRWFCWGRAVERGYCVDDFLDQFPQHVELFFDSDPSLARVVFFIGRALKGRLNVAKQMVFGSRGMFSDHLVSPANRAIAFFATQQAIAARKAVDTWCLVALRVRSSALNRDIRRKIGQLVWEARDLCNYEFME